MARPPLRFGVVYDFRNAPGSGLSDSEIYDAILDQVTLVDQLGFDQIWLTEHHFVDDGYLPSPVVAATAIAARTRRVRISTDILILPFHHPLRLAEDWATLDVLSGGRMELGIGMGYAVHEFRGFGIDRAQRRSLTVEGIEVLRRAWSGERFTHRGKHWTFEDAQVFPRPVQPGGPPLWMAAMTEAGARRTGRLGLNLLPQGTPRAVLDPWRAEMTAQGRNPDQYRVGIIRGVLVSDDLERDWPRLREAERYKMQCYAEWIGTSGDSYTFMDSEQAPIPQTWLMGDAATVLKGLREFIAEHGLTDIVTFGNCPGVRADVLNPSLERLAREVLPKLREG
jgi:alkanesulfonate monooxygenase SsuD/methylene tetrahydromethanopterin reductase-like flavin-dependent oxidoreductase (luciferase family)